jgi:hypothetical protein
MHAPDPRDRPEMTDLERRLAGWAPAPVALNRDAMLFEAGRSSAQTPTCPRLLASLTALSVLALAVAGWAAHEHAQRRDMERLLAERSHALDLLRAELLVVPGPAPVALAAPAPESLIVLSQRLGATGGNDREPPHASPRHDPAPARPDRPLTPFSDRAPGGLSDL